MAQRLGLLCMLMALWIVLSGCQSSTTASSDADITLEFWTLQMGSFKPYVDDMIQTYEHEHPNIRIKWVDVPASEGAKKAITSILAGTAPDVLNLNPDFSSILASRGTLLDIDHWVTPEQKMPYLPVSFEACSFQGKPFGIPWYITSAVTIYNRSLLAQGGYHSAPSSLTELKWMAQDIVKTKKGYLLMPAVSTDGRFFRFLLQSGVPLWNDKQTRLTFADKGAGEVLAYWVSLYKKGLIPKESLTEGQQGAVDRYQSGSLGMLLSGPNFLNIVKENAPNVYKQTDVAQQFPQLSNYVDFAEMIFVIPKQTRHPKEAVDFALFVTNQQNTLKLSSLAPVLPPFTEPLSSPEFNQVTSPDLAIRARSLSAQQLLRAQQTFPVHPLQNRLNQLMDYYVQSAFRGVLSPYDAMTRAQADMNKLLK